ncbi:MAG TPA: hypothetical protein VFE32_05905 [Puia sp.]|nr:hypothetical protein [Puia sp.]
MSRILLMVLLSAAFHSGSSTGAFPPPSGRDIIKKMHDRYAGKWYHSLTFTQTTQRYRNDTLRSTQTWHEFIRFPDRFRMDFGPADSGNAVIFRLDSSYRFTNGQLRSTTINNNEGLIFLLGGMFFYPFDQTCHILSDSLHYDLTQAREDNWKGHPVYVIGKEGANQLWIDKEHLYLVRMIKSDDNMDARFEDWQPFGGGFCETKCRFYIDGKLIQTEIYHDCKTDITLDDQIFDPSKLNRSW